MLTSATATQIQSGLPYNLVQLKRNERRGDDERDVFRPSLAEQQPRAFRQKHGPVGQQAGTHGLQAVFTETSDPLDRSAEVAPIRIDVQSCRPSDERVGGAVATEVREVERDRREQAALGQLEQADEPEGRGARNGHAYRYWPVVTTCSTFRWGAVVWPTRDLI